LVEILIAIVIIGLTAVAIIGALTTSITSAAEHRQLATGDTLAKSFAESVKNTIQLQANDKFENCSSSKTPAQVLADYVAAAPPWSTTNPPPAGDVYVPGYPSNYTVGIVLTTGLEFWNAQTSTFDPGTGAGTCPAVGNFDASGIQRITVKATGPGNVTVTVAVIVRDPQFGASYCTLYKSASNAVCS
jgi:type II secretory pathway pseudopilin PulG